MTEQELADCINPTLVLLGMKLTRCRKIGGALGAYRLEMQMLPETVTLTIDMESVRFGLQPKAASELISRELEDAQLRLHDAIRKALDEKDVRQRIVRLSREDKNALHELIWLAGKAVAFSGPGAEQDQKAYAKGREVVEKLFR